MKKLVSFSLALVMMVTSLFGFASVTFADEKTFVCGKNVNAVYDENTKILTVNGTGDMYDYTSLEGPGWEKAFEFLITSVVIEEGVTSIGDFAFASMMSVKSVSLPSTLKSIGDYAFSACCKLANVTIPASVDSIGRFAFRTTTENEIGKLTAINVDENNQSYCSVDGVLYDKAMTTLIQIPSDVAITTLELPETIETIGEYSGERVQNITKVVVPKSIKMIEEKAFSNSSIQEVVIDTDKVFTISDGFLDGTSAKICSFEGSYAEEFAELKGITFEVLPYCILTFVNNKEGVETEVKVDLNTLPEDINAPVLPTAHDLENGQHMVYSWSPALEKVTKNTTYTATGSPENHTMVDVPNTAQAATIDNAGKNADEKCSVCDYYVQGSVIPQLAHYTITATAENGTAKVDGVSDLGNVKPNGEITLSATADEGYTFVGWSLNGKIVSTDETYTTVAIADADYVAIYEVAEQTEEFTVVFTDQYGNVYGTWTGSDASEIEIPAEPKLAGFTFKGWSMEKDAILALTENTTVMAIFERTDKDEEFTVTVENGTIGDTTETSVKAKYNDKVTVNAPADAKAGKWLVNNAVVAYGTSYTFIVGTDITLTYVEDAEAVEAKPVVAAIAVERDENTHKVAFFATRSLAENYNYVAAGFIYGKNMTTDDLTLANVDEPGEAGNAGFVKIGYCSTDSEQFKLSYGLTSKTGKVAAKAFLVYRDSAGNTTVEYGAFQEYEYDNNQQ